MKYAIGYQLPDEYDSTEQICRDFSDHISNVYFSFGNDPSGRAPLCSDSTQAEAVQQLQLRELRAIRDLGISLTLLLNANCYGSGAISVELVDRTIRQVRMLKEQADIARITTTSPFLAEQLHGVFGDSIRIIASVNMRIGTTQAMAQLAESFDGYYLQKEHNRDLNMIRTLKQWCDGHGKLLHLLGNSGCLPYCGFQTFHDNLIAHEQESRAYEPVSSGFPAPCWKYLNRQSAEEALAMVLQGSWIRPEEIYRYEPFFSEIKLATRMHSRPHMVVAAYVRGHFAGNLLDLTEPSYSTLFRGTILDNTRFPADWGDQTIQCQHQCDRCGYCRTVAAQAAVAMV